MFPHYLPLKLLADLFHSSAPVDGQPTNPIASVETLAFRRLNELNEHFGGIVHDLERDQLHCQQTCVEWVGCALRVFTVQPFWVKQLMEAEREEVAQSETTQLVEVDEQPVMGGGQLTLEDGRLSIKAQNVKVHIEVDEHPQPDRSDSLEEVPPENVAGDEAEKAVKDPAVTNQLLDYYENLLLCELDYEKMIGDFAMQMKSVRLIYSTILMKLTRLLDFVKLSFLNVGSGCLNSASLRRVKMLLRTSKKYYKPLK
ncbi:uncharacterized protein DEA37_0010200 [Paragonimus westermani]|uniref:Uncharacterized protein n=1 Tax=Paragonimus westermani TaxID=34504 RepID=A0A5J4N4A7_9TREM|nr:uncharacterized protein DEA37_0010200 [Paragonimus westermani]